MVSSVYVRLDRLLLLALTYHKYSPTCTEVIGEEEGSRLRHHKFWQEDIHKEMFNDRLVTTFL